MGHRPKPDTDKPASLEDVPELKELVEQLPYLAARLRKGLVPEGRA